MTKENIHDRRSVAETATPRDASNPPEDPPGIQLTECKLKNIYYGICIYITEYIHHRIQVTECVLLNVYYKIYNEDYI